MSESLEQKINQIVEREVPRLRLMQPTDVTVSQSPGVWSRKEILGHLIDSASNNHQRFVRAQFSDELTFPGYAQNDWVRVQGYADEEWQQIVEVWRALNKHLAHMVGRIPKEKLEIQCSIGGNAPVTLEGLIQDYIKHMEHHLAQLT